MNSSEVKIEYERTAGAADWIDITQHGVITSATFDSASNATPGTCEITLRDPDRDLPAFVTGHRVRLTIDGQRMWAGFALINGRGSFFPAGDGREQTRARKRVLRGVDNNLLLDKRVLRDPDHYLKTPVVKTPRHYDGWLIRHAFDVFIDKPSWLDADSEIDDIQMPPYYPNSTTGKWAYPQQGSAIRTLFEDLARFSAAVYYIGPDDKVHYHRLQTVECSWGFSDRPNHYPLHGLSGFDGAYYGFREIDADEDGSELVTDAHVWGGSKWAGTGKTIHHRAVDTVLEGRHGKWQMAETHFDEDHFKIQPEVEQRAHMIVYGIPDHPADPDDPGADPGSVVGEGPRGMRFSQWAYNFTWHTNNVPVFGGVPRHLYPGDIVPIQLWAWSEDDGETPFTKLLPLRSLRISFPAGAVGGRAIVRFTGGFDLRNTDSKFLWRYLRKTLPKIQQTTVDTVDDTSEGSSQGAVGTFSLHPAGDGSRSTFYAVFSGGDRVPYIVGSTQAIINGLEQIVGDNYFESGPDAGEVMFTTPPISTDRLVLRCRTRES